MSVTYRLQWGPVVVTRIRWSKVPATPALCRLQWGPVVVTGIRGEAAERPHCTNLASMGSGRGDRNQTATAPHSAAVEFGLQWGPVVVTGIRFVCTSTSVLFYMLQWGPVVVTGIRSPEP